MNLALLSITIIVARTFGKGLRQRLRHFQILARGEVDLEAIPKQDETTATSTICAAEKNIQDDNRPLSPSVPKGEGSGLSEFVTSAKSSLKESSMLFKAFFSGLGNTDDLESLESLHRESVEVWEQAAPGLANPQLINIFESLSKNASSLAELNGKQSTENLSKYSNHLKHSPQISPSMSKIGDGSNTVQFGSRSTAQGTVSFALSTDELNTINGNAELLNTKQSYVKPTKTSTELRGIGSLKKADPHDHRSTDKIVAASNYADDCALYNTLQQHAVLRVANADSTQDSNDKNDNFVSSRSTINCQMDTLRSVLSYSTAPTSNASFGSAGGSKAKLVNEGFDLSI
ncbi:hypothetical protein GGI25_005698 [Coemansia spiralis]|uniref:Uncharacterized protein n=2 Tax=Coemansia TaxID=4863 RepID=A0A9W8G2E6_9FUNG|nr:hypothetical protein EDC05_005456 [Coemansia umbellata]KAJ2625562.1 hypothetical protein GGI26_000361 [Coemansia sp. RSA 1358]KAJ2670820.1 hypothetical protein GGI25_005698 [Coemansia spiralis]